MLDVRDDETRMLVVLDDETGTRGRLVIPPRGAPAYWIREIDETGEPLADSDVRHFGPDVTARLQRIWDMTAEGGAERGQPAERAAAEGHAGA